MTTKTCPCANPDCALPSGRCALCDQPCDADGRTHEPELCDPCADLARNVRSKLGGLDPGWHVDDTGTPRLVRDDEANVFPTDEHAATFVRGLLVAIDGLTAEAKAGKVSLRSAIRAVAIARQRAHEHLADTRAAEDEVARLRAEAKAWKPKRIDELEAERDALRAEVEALRAGVGGACRSVRDFVDAQRTFSVEAFGPGARTAGIVEHIRRELAEVEADPGDCFEWIDVVILALDGAWRAGHSAASIENALWAKLAKNKARRWPDWRGVDEATPIEHVRDD